MAGSTRRDIAIVGLGRFGASMAGELTRIGDRVLGIDSDEHRVVTLSGEMDSVVQADATDIKALEQLSIGNYEAVMIAIGEDMESSIIATMNAMELGCEALWVKAQGAMHERILKRLGVHNIVLPEEHAGKHIAQMVHNPLIRDYLTLGDHRYVVQMAVTDELIDRSLSDLQFDEFGLICIAMQRTGELCALDEQSRTLKEGDTLILYGKRDAVREFSDSL